MLGSTFAFHSFLHLYLFTSKDISRVYSGANQESDRGGSFLSRCIFARCEAGVIRAVVTLPPHLLPLLPAKCRQKTNRRHTLRLEARNIESGDGDEDDDDDDDDDDSPITRAITIISDTSAAVSL